MSNSALNVKQVKRTFSELLQLMLYNENRSLSRQQHRSDSKKIILHKFGKKITTPKCYKESPELELSL